MKNFNLIFIIGAIVLCVALAPVRADLITIAISGQVTGVSDEYNLFGGQISVNDVISGTYTYDSAISDSDPWEMRGYYVFHSAPAGISLNVGNFNFRTNSNSVDFYIEIVNNELAGTDDYAVRSYNNLPLPGDIPVDHIVWQLSDYTGTALSSDVLPLTAPDLSKWEPLFGIGIGSQRDRDTLFEIQAVVATATLVPEPATLLTLLFGSLFIRKSLS